jgi:hypothetical protein
MSKLADALVSLVMNGSEEYPVLMALRRLLSRVRVVLQALFKEGELNIDAML